MSAYRSATQRASSTRGVSPSRRSHLSRGTLPVRKSDHSLSSHEAQELLYLLEESYELKNLSNTSPFKKKRSDIYTYLTGEVGLLPRVVDGFIEFRPEKVKYESARDELMAFEEYLDNIPMSKSDLVAFVRLLDAIRDAHSNLNPDRAVSDAWRLGEYIDDLKQLIKVEPYELDTVVAYLNQGILGSQMLMRYVNKYGQSRE